MRQNPDGDRPGLFLCLVLFLGSHVDVARVISQVHVADVLSTLSFYCAPTDIIFLFPPK